MPDFHHHAMQPSTNLDEQARQDFVGAFRGHLSGRLMPGAYQVYAARVEPAFRSRQGRSPADQEEVRKVMTAVTATWQLYGAPAESVIAEYPQCAHDFPPETRERVYQWLRERLD